MIMVERIEQLMKYYQYSASQFANEIGIQRSALSHIMSGRNKPSLDFVLKLLTRFPEVNSEWILFGKGSMFKNAGSTLSAGKERSHTIQENLFDIQTEATDSSEDRKEGDLIEEEEKGQKKSSEPIGTEDDEIEKIVFFYKNGKFKLFEP